MTSRPFRPYSELPEDLHARLVERTEEQREEMGYLFFHWVVTAAAMADAGFGHLLPQERKAVWGTLGGKGKAVRWKQNPDAYARCKASIDAAGSSVPAVLRQATQRYLTDRFQESAVTSWPFKSALQRVLAEAVA
jgi:hypothetical protein